MIFSEKQRQAFELYRRGENLFVTGAGGSGKTALLRQIYKDAELRKIKVKTTALTGCAAILLGCKARTIHSFAGIGIGTGSNEEIIKRVKKNLGKIASWKSVQLLMIDEVSMMSKRLLEILEAVARAVRKNDKPFGGVQVIFSGDFFQIRPVPNDRDPDTAAFCFESPLWDEIIPKKNHVKLDQIFRQKDQDYLDILNAIREGRVEQHHIDIMMERVRTSNEEEEDTSTTRIRPTKLFPTRRQVDAVNRYELAKLPADDEHEYVIQEHTDLPMTPQELKKRVKATAEEIRRELDYLKRNLMCDDEIMLRVGAQVMCVVNKEIPDKMFLCNGSQGVVVGFEEDNPIVRFRNGVEVVMMPHIWASEFIPGVGVSQVPLIISFACTVHKMQGSTLESAEIDVGRFVFECGQTYVALSRLKSLEGLHLKDFDPSKIFVDAKVVAFYKSFD